MLDALAALRRRLGEEAFQVVDHWEADRHPVGIAARSKPGQLVYFFCSERNPGRFYVALEKPPVLGSDFPYSPGDVFEDVDFEELANIVAAHIGLRLMP